MNILKILTSIICCILLVPIVSALGFDVVCPQSAKIGANFDCVVSLSETATDGLKGVGFEVSVITSNLATVNGVLFNSPFIDVSTPSSYNGAVLVGVPPTTGDIATITLTAVDAGDAVITLVGKTAQVGPNVLSPSDLIFGTPKVKITGADLPCVDANWVESVGACDVTCGTGKKITTYTKIKIAGVECVGTKPQTEEVCEMPACPDVCTPSCPSSATICSGVTATPSNGCDGTCNVPGTKDCSPGCDSPKVIIDGACKDVVVVDSLDDKTNLQNIYDIIKQGGNKLAQITGIASILKSIFG
jgi:hypothetical protein